MKKISLSLLFCLLLGKVATSQIHITFDYSNAEQTIVFFNKATIIDADIAALIKTNGVKAIIRKIHATDAIAEIALRKAHAGVKATGTELNFQYGTIQKNLQGLQKFMATIKRQEKAMADSVNSLVKYIPNGKQLQTKVVFLLGSYSGGFTFGADSVLYIGLHQYQYDVASIMNTVKHELFHNIQRLNYNNDSVALQLQRKKEMDALYFYYLARSIFAEGSAEYVADFTKLNPNTPDIKAMTEHFAVNNDRMSDNFYLLERVLMDAFKNNKAIDLGSSYSLLFDWNWNNPGYAVGKLMTDELVKAYGTEVLKKYLQADPMQFIKDYATLAKTKKLDYQFSKEFEDVLDVVIAKVNPPGKKL
jgi:hypothetical protein